MSRLSRREFLKMAGVVASASVVAACAPAAPTEAPKAAETKPTEAPKATEAKATEAPKPTAAPVSKGAIKLELWTFVNTHARWFRSMAEDYKKDKNPDFDLNVSEIAYGDMHDKTQIALQAGGVGAPDLVDLEQGRFGGFLRGTGDVGLVDLTEQLKSGGYMDKLVGAREALYSYKGKTYGIEHALCPCVNYYRSDVFEKAGIDVKKIATWDDWIAAVKPLCKDDVMACSFLDHGTILRQMGSDYFDADGKVTLDSDQSVQAMDWILAMATTQKIARQGPSGDAWYAALKEGKFVSTPAQADWYAGFISDNVPDLKGKWMASPMPVFKAGGSPTSCNGGTGNCIVKYSKNVDEAWKFQQYSMLSVEGNVRRYLLTSLWPPFIPAMSDQRLHKPNEYFNNQDLGQVFAEVGPKVPAQYQSPYRAEMNSLISPMWQDMYDGKVAPKDAFKQVADKVRKLMQEEGAA